MHPDLSEVATVAHYQYGSTGVLTNIVNEDGSITYLNVGSRDELGRPTYETAGDHTYTQNTYDWLKGALTITTVGMPITGTRVQGFTYGYDENLNVTSRIDRTISSATRTEAMTYDEMNRLSSWQENSGTGYRWRVEFGMDDLNGLRGLGNLTDRRTYVAGPNGTTPLAQHIHYGYPTTNGATQPHAIQSTDTPVLTTDIPAQNQQSLAGPFSYGDAARGTQTGRPGGETVAYSAFELPTSVSKGHVASFKYDASGRRALKGENLGTMNEVSTRYQGRLYERRKLSTGNVAHVFYVMAGNRVVAQVTRMASDPSSAAVDYFHHDGLGSVTAVTMPTGPSSATTLGRVLYDPYGTQYAPGGIPYLTDVATEVAPGVRRGFTGHEMDYDLGLVNMQGRMYDAKTSRFLSMDPSLASATFDQAYNRYAYVLNNPFKYTDPSGYNAVACSHTYINQYGDPVTEQDTCDDGVGDDPERDSLFSTFYALAAAPTMLDERRAEAAAVAAQKGTATSDSSTTGNDASGSSVVQTGEGGKFYGAGPALGEIGELSKADLRKLDQAIGIAMDLSKNSAFTDAFRDTVGQLTEKTNLPRELYASSLNKMTINIAEASRNPRALSELRADVAAAARDPNYRSPPAFQIGDQVYLRVSILRDSTSYIAAQIMHEAAHLAGAPGDPLAEIGLNALHEAAGLPR